MAQIIPFIPPVDDIVAKLGVSAAQLRITPLHNIANSAVLMPDADQQISAYVALKHIALIIDSMAEASLHYLQGQSTKGGVA